MKVKPKRTFLVGIGAIIIFFIALFPIMERYSQSFKFVDEDEHLVIGSLMLRGWRLYKDTSGNHQPLVFIGSAVIQKISQPPNTFMLIKRHREAVFFWGFIWSILLYLRFGTRAIPAIVVFESLKYLVLGDHFLGESLAVYPFMYLFGVLFDQLINQITKQEDLVIGALAAMTTFLLLPLAVPACFIVCMRLFNTKGKYWIQLLLGTLLVVVPLFIIVSPTAYFKETIVNNVLYAIPAIAEAKTTKTTLSLMSLPFTTWISSRNSVNDWISLISLAWFIAIIAFVRRRQYRLILAWFALFFIWGGSNSRVLESGKYFYEGFHLVPWLGVGTLLASLFIVKINKWLMVGFAVLSVLLLGNRNTPIFAKIDPQTENYIQNAPMTTVGQIIKILSDPDDRLVSLPNETLVYFDTKLSPAMHQVGFNDWQYSVPDKRIEYFDMITNHPPEFIFFHNEGSRYTPSIEKLQAQKYLLLYRISRGTAGFARLYIRKDKAETISVKQWKEVADLPIDIEPIVIQYSGTGKP